MATLSKDILKRLILLYLLSKFERGIYGDLRLQKIVYFLEKKLSLRPFSFKKYYLGPYSEELERIKNLLVFYNWIKVIDVGKTGSYVLNANKETKESLGNLFKKIPRIERELGTFLSEYAYIKNKILKEKSHQTEDFLKAKLNDVILSENIPEQLSVDINKEDIEDLELGLNEEFIKAIHTCIRLTEAKPNPSWREVVAKL